MRRARVGAILVALASAGCPALLKDDYVVGPSDGGDGDSGATRPNDADVGDARPPEEGGVIDAGADGTASDAADAAGPCIPACHAGRSCVAGKCAPGWTATAAPPAGFVARQRAASCAMGQRVFVWGGATSTTELSDGAIYNPTTDTWTSIAPANAPTARVGASCVWTGSVVVVFGGGNLAETADLNTGGVYNPANSTWTATPGGGGAPTARRYARMFWTGTHVAVVNGEAKNGAGVKDAFFYDPAGAGAWLGKAGGTESVAALDQATALAGSDVVVFGGIAGGIDLQGLDVVNTTARMWSAPSNVGAPTARSGAFAAADGTTIIVWGGTSAGGGRYVAGGGWGASLATVNQPSVRRTRGTQSGWAARLDPGAILVMGGIGATATDFKKDGAIYDLGTNTWTPVPAWPSGSDHEWGAGVMTTSGEFVAWGGRNAGVPTAAGDRWHR